MRAGAIILLLIVTVSLSIAPTYASNITITVKKQQAQVQAIFGLSLHQNITQLPNQTSTLDIATDKQLASAFISALKKTNTAATPSNLAVNIVSVGPSLTITSTMTLAGISERRGDILSVDMGWKALNITADLRAGNLSYNTLGSRYFRPVVEFYANASRFVGRPNATITGVSFLVNGTSVGPPTAENYAGNFTIFDFTELSTPLEKWERTYSLSNDTTTWHFAPPQRLNFLITIQRQNRTTDFFATYRYDAEITVSGIARAHGDTLAVDAGTGQQEWIMAGIVALAVISAIATQSLFRTKKKKYAKFGRW